VSECTTQKPKRHLGPGLSVAFDAILRRFYDA
jgi:hypothetical protein